MSDKLIEQATRLRLILEKERSFTSEDLQTLRENTPAAASLSGKSDYFVFRMEIELIDAIGKLDRTSSRLARIGIWVTAVGVGLAVVQIVLAAMY
jgi:hypothetical protein